MFLTYNTVEELFESKEIIGPTPSSSLTDALDYRGVLLWVPLDRSSMVASIIIEESPWKYEFLDVDLISLWKFYKSVKSEIEENLYISFPDTLLPFHDYYGVQKFLLTLHRTYGIKQILGLSD